MTYSLIGLSSLGTITREESTKDAQLFQMALPRTDSTGTIVLDLFGVNRTITIEGIYTVADGTISTFIGQLDALVAGVQISKTYHSDKGYGNAGDGNYKVFIQSVKWSSEGGDVNKVNYTINMIEAAQVT